MWLFYEIEEIDDLNFSQETISPFVFTDYEQIITFATEKYKAHTLHEHYYVGSSNIYIFLTTIRLIIFPIMNHIPFM